MKRTTTKKQHATLSSALRKTVSVFASCALAVSMLGIPAFADELEDAEGQEPSVEELDASTTPSTNEEGEETQSEGSENTNDDTWTLVDSEEGLTEDEPDESTKLPSEVDEEEESFAKSIIHVDVTDAKPFAKASTVFSVSLTNRGYQTITTQPLYGETYQGSYTYLNVDPGEYTLTVTADKHERYQQDITVDEGTARSYTVKISTWDNAGSDAAQSGVMFYGDVNHDSYVSESDVDALIDTLEADAGNAAIADCDLTGSGSVSLADLQVLAEGLHEDGYAVTSNVPAKPRITTATTANATVPADSQIQDVNEVVGNPDEHASLKMATENGAAISEDNPLLIQLDGLQSQIGEDVGCITIKPPLAMDENGSPTVHPHAITGGTAEVVYDDENGVEQTMTYTIGETANVQSVIEQAAMLTGLLPERAYAAGAAATIDAAGNIVIDFGKKIAIKKVTITVTKTQAADGNLNLAEISAVEFLNGTEDLVAPPEMNIPTNLTATPASKQFTVSWNAEPNVTGYEVSISENGNEQIMSTKNTTLVVSSFQYGNKGKVENNHTYTVKVQSTNGAWRSGWSNAITVTPKAEKKPAAPESVRVTGAYKTLSVSWKAMEDTDYYFVSYRKEGESAWQKTGNIERNSYQLTGLEDTTTYEIFVTGHNDLGDGAPSRTVVGTTTTIAPAELPTYKLINSKDANGRYLTGISAARVISATMQDSPLDASGTTALGLFDDDYTSYAQKNDWDMGSAYNAGNHGIEVTFDSVKEIGFISWAASTQNISYSSVAVHASTGGSAWQRVQGVTFTQQQCANGRTYTLVKLPGGLRADKVLIGMERRVRLIDIAEMRFHGYDSIEDDVAALYADDMHIQLAQGVDEARIDELDTRLNTADVDGNYYPYKAAVQMDLDFARQLLADEKAGLSEVIEVHTDISSALDSGKALGMGGLNSWQPLGKVAAAGDQLVLYASARNASSNSKVQMYVGQQYPEVSAAPSYGGTFNVGTRTIYTVPEKIQEKDKEHGGPLYAQYTGNNPDETWYIRVMGGHSIPTLDLHNVSDHEERVAKAEQFVNDLDQALQLLEASKASEDAHRAAHQAESKLVVDKVPSDTINPSVDCNYNDRNCIHNAAEIMTDTMLYSVPATQAARACTGSSVRERAEALIQHMDGSEQLMKLFYQHKGLMEASANPGATNTISSQHLNIRCMVMFDGAFMYAAGNHIGVDFPQSGNFAILSAISEAATKPGATRQAGDGQYFGWGTAHEIGHNINNSRYSYAEVTNNYFAQLCRMINEGTTRFSYDTVYDRVTSGATGRTGNVFTQLAMYWQLMLAHDSNEIYTLYDNYADLHANRFFARVDSYARNPASAPAPKGVALVCNAGESQNIIRLASAAAEMDLTDFFTSWGMIPNAETAAYIGQFDKESRALQYVNDDAAAWAKANPTAAKVAGVDMVQANASQSNSKVTLSLGSKDAAYNASLIGYEISRVTYASGAKSVEVVGFARADANGAASFVDDAAYLGNRAVSYEVKAVDKFLNYSATAGTNQMKLDGNGRYTPAEWTIESNLVQVGGDQSQGEVNVSDEPECPSELAALAKNPIESILTGEGEFVGRTNKTEDADAADPYLMVDMKKTNGVVSVRYTPGEGTPLTDYVIETSVNGLNFTEVARGTFTVDEQTGYADVYFTGKNEDGTQGAWICMENARYVRITAPGAAGRELSLKELSIFGPSGDNIDFTAVAGQEDVKAIGTLTDDFQLDANDPSKVIPKGSVIFTGSVKGNPAYNVVVMYGTSDLGKDGIIVGGSDTNADGDEVLRAEQVLLAEVADVIGETADGRWVYWIAPDDGEWPTYVRAELYRVNDAFTNEGQRLVADTTYIEVPAKDALPGITLTSASQNQ